MKSLLRRKWTLYDIFAYLFHDDTEALKVCFVCLTALLLMFCRRGRGRGGGPLHHILFNLEAQINCCRVKCFTIYLLTVFQHRWIFFYFPGLLIGPAGEKISTTVCIRLPFTHKIRLVGSPSHWLRNYSSCCLSKSDVISHRLQVHIAWKALRNNLLHLSRTVCKPGPEWRCYYSVVIIFITFDCEVLYVSPR